MRIEYDKQADAAYIHLASAKNIAADKTMACETSYGMINFDLDHEGRFLGIEILEAQVQLPESMLAPGHVPAISLIHDRLRDTAYLRLMDVDPEQRPLYSYDDDFENFKILHDDHGKIIGVLLARASATLPLEIIARINSQGQDDNKVMVEL